MTTGAGNNQACTINRFHKSKSLASHVRCNHTKKIIHDVQNHSTIVLQRGRCIPIYLPQLPRLDGACPGAGRRPLPLRRFRLTLSARAHLSSGVTKPFRRFWFSAHNLFLLPPALPVAGRDGSHGVGGAKSGTKPGTARDDKISVNLKACDCVSFNEIVVNSSDTVVVVGIIRYFSVSFVASAT